MYCNQCGKRIPDDSKFCSYCGVKLNRDFFDQDVIRNHYSLSGISFEEPRRERKGLSAVLLLVFVILLCITAFIFAVGYFNSEAPMPVAEPSQSPTPTITSAPMNGQIFVRPGYGCVCPISVSVSGDDAYYIYLEYIKEPEYTVEARARNSYMAEANEDMAFFIRPNATVELNVPIGVYKLYYASGQTWISTNSLFGDDTAYFSSDDLLYFYATDEGYNGHSLELWLQEGGNFDSDQIDAEDFPG